jgi:pimeloyl-ACP methyl ester carboxylesterase
MRRFALPTALLVLLAPFVAEADERTRAGRQLSGLHTSDGTWAALYRYVPEGGAAGARARVLLFPDVGMNHRAFDLGGRGLAPYLMRRGFEVLVLEYRGAGASQVPLGGFGFSELVDRDAEAALAAATEDGSRVVLCGHGLGGTIAFVLAGRHPDRVAGVVGLQAAAMLDVPNEPVGRLLDSLDCAPPWLDLATLSRTPLFHGRSWFEVMAANDGSISAEVAARLQRFGLAPIPRCLAAELSGFMRSGRIEAGGADVRETIRGWKGPTLLFFAPLDNWIHPEFATPMRDVLEGETQVRVLSVLEGTSVDLGHLGTLFADSARLSVYDPIVDFLEGKGGAP